MSALDYRGFYISPKRDFGPYGFFDHGRYIKIGYVVVDGKYGFTNVMPGATWFYTIEGAKHAVDVLIEVGGGEPYSTKNWLETGNWSDEFWTKLNADNTPNFWELAWKSNEEDFSDLMEGA